MKTGQELRIYHAHGKQLVHVPSHRGEELFMQLASQGVESRVARVNGHAELELDDDVNLEVVRAILQRWQA